MFDLGWQEFFLIAVIGLLVVGPRDLPGVIRTVVKWIRKVRTMARDFQNSIEEVAREAELDEIRKEAQKLSKTDITSAIRDTVDPDGEMTRSVEETRRSIEKESRIEAGETVAAGEIPAASETPVAGEPLEAGETPAAGDEPRPVGEPAPAVQTAAAPTGEPAPAVQTAAPAREPAPAVQTAAAPTGERQ